MEKQNDKKTKKLKNSLTIALSIISCIIVQHTTSAIEQNLTKIKPTDIITTEINKFEKLGEEGTTQLLKNLAYYYTYALSQPLSIPLEQIKISDEEITLQQQTIPTLLSQIDKKIKEIPTKEGTHTTQAITTTTFSKEDKHITKLKQCQQIAEYILHQADKSKFTQHQNLYIEILEYLQSNKTRISELISKTYNAQLQGQQNQIANTTHQSGNEAQENLISNLTNTPNPQIGEIITLATEYLASILQIKQANPGDAQPRTKNVDYINKLTQQITTELPLLLTSEKQETDQQLIATQKGKLEQALKELENSITEKLLLLNNVYQYCNYNSEQKKQLNTIGSAYITVLKKIFKTSDIYLKQLINQNQPVVKTSFTITQEQLEAINLIKRNKRAALPPSKAQYLESNLNIDTHDIGNLSNQQEQENTIQEEERRNQEAEVKAKEEEILKKEAEERTKQLMQEEARRKQEEETIRQLKNEANDHFNKNKLKGSNLTTTHKIINNLNATNNMLQIIRQILY